MSVGSREQIEEERRLLYVAMTRARDHLHLVQPMRLFRSHQHRHGDGHVLAMRSRFIPDGILHLFERGTQGRAAQVPASSTGSPIRVDVAASDAGDVGLSGVRLLRFPEGITDGWSTCPSTSA
jgi:DNA helicase-2/ATP-dependent DNA helicase PcrA